MIPTRRRRLITTAAMAACACLLATCKDSSGPPEERVMTVELAGGEAQTGAVATALAQPLIARALDTQSQPVANARIEWLVTAGGGSVVAGAETTDADGRASATWTLGTAAGPQTLTAQVGTVSAVFHATAAPGPAVTVTIAPDQVLLDAIGDTAQLTVTAVDAHGNAIAGRAATWTSSDVAVASVNGAGLVSAVAPGTSSIEARLDDATSQIDVTVDPQPAAIAIDPPTAQFAAIGDTIRFAAHAQDRNGHPVTVTGGSFTWSSSNALIVTVDATGLAQAQGSGSTQVNAALGALTGAAQVVVSQVVASLSVEPEADTLSTAKPTVQLAAVARDANGQPIGQPPVTWTSSANAVATVSQTGLVSAVTNGTAYIRATTGTFKDSATIVVQLNAPPRGVADTLGAVQGTQLTVAAPGLLANDTLGIPAATVASFGGGDLAGTVTSNNAGTNVTFGTSGSLRVNANGSLTFMADAGFTGNFTFQYRVQNAAGFTDATVTLQVGVAPTAVDDAYSTGIGVTLNVAAPGALANDNPGNPLVAAIASFGGPSLGGPVTKFTAGQRVGFGIGGFIQLNADGSLSFTPPTGFSGTFTFQYRLVNSAGSSDASIAITVS